MTEATVYNPTKPDFMDLGRHPRPNVHSMDDFGDAYSHWAERSGLYDYVDNATYFAVASELDRLLREPIPSGNYKGQARFVPANVARKLGVDAVELPDERLPFIGNHTLRERLAALMYHQGSSEFGSGQQQAMLNGKMGHVPPIYYKYLTFVVREEGEHGFQAGYYLGNCIGGNYGWGLAEDLLAREADSKDPKLQQPLNEFNPMVTTLPELGHYFNCQDRDGWAQLMQQKNSSDAVFAGLMRYFLKQENFHLAAGQHLVQLYVRAARIPMDLHLRLAFEWEGRAFRLHGNPYASGGAETNYLLGAKTPILSLEKAAEKGSVLIMPHREYGFIEIPLTPSMPKGHLNGFAMNETRNRLLTNNRRLSALLNSDQRREMRRFLDSDVTKYVPHKERKELIESSIIPTAAVSWRPEHMVPLADSDPWPHLNGYYTDVFGYPIPSRREYDEYVDIVRVKETDRERIRDLTRQPGWIVEVEPGSLEDVYRNGPVQPCKDDGDTVLFNYTVTRGGRRLRNIFTMPQRIESSKKEKTRHERTEAGDFMADYRDDILG